MNNSFNLFIFTNSNLSGICSLLVSDLGKTLEHAQQKVGHLFKKTSALLQTQKRQLISLSKRNPIVLFILKPAFLLLLQVLVNLNLCLVLSTNSAAHIFMSHH